MSSLPTASLCIYGTSLDPNALTAELGLTPTVSHKRGDTITSGSGKSLTAKIGTWILQSSDRRHPPEMHEVINEVLSKISYRSPIGSFPGVEICMISVAVGFGEQPSIGVLAPETLLKVASLGLSLDIEVYPDGPSEQEGLAQRVQAVKS